MSGLVQTMLNTTDAGKERGHRESAAFAVRRLRDGLMQRRGHHSVAAERSRRKVMRAPSTAEPSRKERTERGFEAAHAGRLAQSAWWHLPAHSDPRLAIRSCV